MKKKITATQLKDLSIKVFNLFKKQEVPETTPIFTDIHSHLLPGLDDGVESFDESVEIIKDFQALGYKKLITTPHIMQDFYNNSAESIIAIGEALKTRLKEEHIAIELSFAAEYYLDDQLMAFIEDDNQELLTFGDSYLLFETSFMNQPFYLNDFIFKAKSRGINPILAHPERYVYLQSNPGLVDDLKLRGVLLQVNLNSISGYYSKPVQKIAQRLINSKKVDFLGSDCHNINHMEVLKNTINEKYYKRALTLPLLNNTL